ncbi:MAG: hypothetical protein R8K49_02865 [Mariprofundaceae bacterium]
MRIDDAGSAALAALSQRMKARLKPYSQGMLNLDPKHKITLLFHQSA